MLTETKIIARKTYDEATRYMNNAHKELQHAKKNGEHYHDVKHLRVACGTAYLAALKALDGIFILRGIPKPKGRPSIEYYQQHLSQLDKKILDTVNDAYKILHLSGYYDGLNDVSVIKIGFEKAKYIILKLKQAL